MVSEKPWSDYSKADYTPEQWHAACLIHQHEGAPTSKGQCKIPVKTPNGVVNRNGVHAAAAALAGARGGVDASSEEKASASKALLRLYSQLDEEPPDSLRHDALAGFLSHHGVKGMKWGVRRAEGGRGRKAAPEASEDKAKANVVSAKVAKGNTSALSNQELQTLVTRMNLEQQYSRLTEKPSKFQTGKKFVDNALSTGTTINNVIKFVNSPSGKITRTLVSKSSKQQKNEKIKEIILKPPKEKD